MLFDFQELLTYPFWLFIESLVYFRHNDATFIHSFQLLSIELSAKSVRIQSFYGPYFHAFGLNTMTYVFLRIQSKCEKIRTRKTSNTDTFHVVFIK